MEPTQPSRTEGPVRESGPYHPPPNGAELRQRAPTTSPIMTSSTTNPGTPIFSPIPTRPPPFRSTEAVPHTTTMSIEGDPTPHNLAEIDQNTHQAPPPQAATSERPRQPCPIRQRQRQRQREDDRQAKAGAALAADMARMEHRRRVHAARRARQLRESRRHAAAAATPDALAERLGALSTDDPVAGRPRGRRRDRDARDRHGGGGRG